MKKFILIVTMLLIASPLFAFEFMEKMDPGEIIDATGYHWAGPFKALSIMAAPDGNGRELVGIRITGFTRWPASPRKMDWHVMQAAISSGRAVWLYMNTGQTQWGYIAVGQKPTY